MTARTTKTLIYIALEQDIVQPEAQQPPLRPQSATRHAMSFLEEAPNLTISSGYSLVPNLIPSTLFLPFS